MLKSLISKLKHFPENATGLFWFFIAVNLIPSVFLVLTEPYSLVGKIILITFPLGMYFLLLSLLRNIGLMQLILIPQLVFNAFQLVLFYLFGESVIAVDMFLNLATTNITEAGELLNNLWPAIIFVCVVYIPTIILAGVSCAKKAWLSSQFRRRMALGGLAIAILSYGLTFIAENKDTGTFSLKENVFPVDVYNNLNLAVRKWEHSSLYPITSKDFHFNARKEKQDSGRREIYTLVIGEAGRAGNWSMWGYGRETNPELAGTPGVVIYKDAITQANATHKSVPLILSAVSAENFDSIYHQKSIVTAFKEVGFKTIFLSNQTPNRTFTDYFAEEADHHINIRPITSGGIYSTNNYDDQMIPILRHYIDSLPDNLFIVLHTYGSHFNYRERYPESFSHFLPDNATEIETENRQQLINAYDNSIRYTDHFLHNLTQVLDSSGASTALYYTPDHGEDLLDDSRERFLHASPHPTYYQLHIPILMWFSDTYRTDFPERYSAAVANSGKPISTNSAFHTMLDMASVTTPYLNPQRSLVNPVFRSERRMYLTDHDRPIPFYNSGLKKQDKEMIREKGMDHR